MQARIPNLATSVHGALDALQALGVVAVVDGHPKTTIDLVHVRASQISGYGVRGDRTRYTDCLRIVGNHRVSSSDKEVL